MSETTQQPIKRFVMISQDAVVGGSLCVVVDTVTRVQYALVVTPSQTTFQVLIDAEGKPLIYHS